MSLDTQTAVGVMYKVSLDNASIGSFATCEGLGVEVVIETREEGGSNGFIWQFPTRLKYPNIKLTRPLGKETADVLAWVSSVIDGYKRSTGTIEAMTAHGESIAVWEINDVIPVRWTGPSLNPDQPKVLIETLEIAHHGFGATKSAY